MFGETPLRSCVHLVVVFFVILSVVRFRVSVSESVSSSMFRFRVVESVAIAVNMEPCVVTVQGENNVHDSLEGLVRLKTVKRGSEGIS